MKYFKLTGFTMAMVLLTNGPAFAGETYQPAEYRPKLDYAVPETQAMTAEAPKVAEAVDTQGMESVKEQQVEIQAPSALAKASEDSSKVVEPAPMPSLQSEEVASSNGDILPIVAVLAGVGVFFFMKKLAKTRAASVSPVVSVEPSQGSTGVERYIDRLAEAEKTGVEKYLERQAEIAPATGVAKYLARRAARDRA